MTEPSATVEQFMQKMQQEQAKYVEEKMKQAFRMGALEMLLEISLNPKEPRKYQNNIEFCDFLFERWVERSKELRRKQND